MVPRDGEGGVGDTLRAPRRRGHRRHLPATLSAFAGASNLKVSPSFFHGELLVVGRPIDFALKQQFP